MENSEKIDLSTIVRAQKVFEQFRQDLTTDKDKTATVQAFGSRVKGKQRRFSDLDIYSPDFIPLDIQGQIEEDFEKSDLPFTVDIVPRYRMTSEFQAIIQKELVLIQKSPTAN